MFLITIKAATMTDLRAKLLEAAHSMVAAPSVKLETRPEKLGYEPVTEITHDESEQIAQAANPPVTAMPTFHPVAPEQPFQPQYNAAPVAMPSFAGHTPVAPPPAAAAPQATSGELDARGYPWDGRIHASSKTKNKDGSWRTRRGVTDDQVREIQSQTGKPQAAAPAYVPPVPASPMALPPTAPPQWAAPPLAVVPPMQQWTPPPVAPAPVAQVPLVPALAPVPAAAPAYQNVPTPPAEVQKPAHTLETFKDKIIDTFVLLVSTGKIDQHYIEQLKAHFKVKEIWDVKDNPAQLSEIFENFVGSGLITRIG